MAARPDTGRGPTALAPSSRGAKSGTSFCSSRFTRSSGRERARRRGRRAKSAAIGEARRPRPPRRSRLDVPRAATRRPGAADQPARVLRLGHARGRRARSCSRAGRPVAPLQRVHPADQPGPRHLAHLGLLGLRRRDACRRLRPALRRPAGRPLRRAPGGARGGAAVRRRRIAFGQVDHDPDRWRSASPRCASSARAR